MSAMNPIALLAGVLLMTLIAVVFVLSLYALAWVTLTAGDAISEWNFNRRVRNGDIPAPYRAFYDGGER